MGFDAQGFLDRYASAYNDRDPEGMRSFFDLSDPGSRSSRISPVS